ncbi:MAG: MFS family permease [Desulforhopalus sp.]|jgi:MFS family permease
MDQEKDACFKKNAVGVASVEFFWGLGFPIVLESTFLQLFLKSLGASSFTIGIVPSLFIFGISIFPLFASYISRNRRFKRPLVTILHIVSGLSIFLFGVALCFVHEVKDVLILFFASYTVFSLCMGLTIPVWLNYLVRIFSDAKAVAGFGYMMLAQNVGKVCSSFFILKVVDTYAFSLASSAWVFMGTGLLFIIGSFGFFLTTEVADPDDPDQDDLSFVRHTMQALAEILRNRRFLIFLVADLDFYVIITIMSFYANYATGFFGVSAPVAAGTFVGCIYAGSITVNIFLGVMNVLGLKQKFVLSKLLSLFLLVLLTFLPGYYSFFLISYLLGFVRAIRNMVYAPSIKKFAGKVDVTSYFALAPILTIPIGSGFPLLFGKALDLLSFMGADAYRVLFAASAGFILITLFFSLMTDFRDAAGADH